MSESDLHKIALRGKVVEMIRMHARRRFMKNAYEYWRRLIQAN
ncbi:MAG: hypothetical protein ACI906_001573 [Candidatus Latescibacterota bacterium]|jgi:hypothetical protein